MVVWASRTSGDGGEVFGHRAVTLALRDLDGDERGDGVAQRGGVQGRRQARDHPLALHPVQARLHGAPRYLKATRRLQHPHPGLGVQ